MNQVSLRQEIDRSNSSRCRHQYKFGTEPFRQQVMAHRNTIHTHFASPATAISAGKLIRVEANRSQVVIVRYALVDPI